MPQLRRRRRAAWVAVLAVGIVAADSGWLLTESGHRHSPSAGTLVHRDLGALADPARIVLQEAATREQELKALLARRADAVRHHDEASFLASVDPTSVAFATRQRQRFANMAQVPLASFSYQLGSAATAEARPHPVRFGSAGTLISDVTESYALSGYDRRPVSLHQVLTFVHRQRGWLIAADDDLAPLQRPADRDLWDFGPIQVYRGRHTLVLGHPQAGASLRQAADEADRDIPDVTAVWGTDWAQQVVVLLPATQAELGALIHENGDLSQIAAVQSTELHSTGHGPPQQVGDRIALNPTPFANLSPLGRRIVFTHEIAHVAARQSTTDAMPLWLVEGFADYVGFLHSGLSVPVVAQELAAQVREQGLPSMLPADADFRATNPSLAAAYEQSWLACRVISKERGQAGLVALYRAVGASSLAGDQAVSAGLQKVLQQSPAAFTAAWRATVRIGVGHGNG